MHVHTAYFRANIAMFLWLILVNTKIHTFSAHSLFLLLPLVDDGAIDIWSVGCILAEMISRKPLLPGRNYQHQLQLTLDVLGAPPEEDLTWMKHLPAYKHVKAQVAAVKKKSSAYGGAVLTKMFPTVDPAAVDLLTRMLSFDPSKRITVDEALAHLFMADYHDPTDEPASVPPPSSIFEVRKYNL